jgi:hypothetical protein
LLTNTPSLVIKNLLLEANSSLFVTNNLLFIANNPLFVTNNLLFIANNPLFVTNNLLVITNNLLFANKKHRFFRKLQTKRIKYLCNNTPNERRNWLKRYTKLFTYRMS